MHHDSDASREKTATDTGSAVRRALVDAVGRIEALAADVASSVVLVPGADLSIERVAELLRELRRDGQLAVAVWTEREDGEVVMRLAGADPELTHLARELERMAAEDPTTTARSMASRGSMQDRRMPAAARASGIKSLREADPERHGVLVQRYVELVKASLEQRAYRVTRDLNASLISIARELAALQADPRDCVSIQTDAVEQIARWESPAVAEMAQDEGTLLLIELVGYLARCYRDGISVDALGT